MRNSYENLLENGTPRALYESIANAALTVLPAAALADHFVNKNGSTFGRKMGWDGLIRGVDSILICCGNIEDRLNVDLKAGRSLTYKAIVGGGIQRSLSASP